MEILPGVIIDEYHQRGQFIVDIINAMNPLLKFSIPEESETITHSDFRVEIFFGTPLLIPVTSLSSSNLPNSRSPLSSPFLLPDLITAKGIGIYYIREREGFETAESSIRLIVGDIEGEGKSHFPLAKLEWVEAEGLNPRSMNITPRIEIENLFFLCRPGDLREILTTTKEAVTAELEKETAPEEALVG